MGLSDEEARYYAEEYNSGSTILAVDAPDREQEALSILHQYGAYHVTGGKPDTPEEAASDVLQSSERNRIEPQAAQPVHQAAAARPGAGDRRPRDTRRGGVPVRGPRPGVRRSGFRAGANPRPENRAGTRLTEPVPD